jgi:hypothetical protein
MYVFVCTQIGQRSGVRCIFDSVPRSGAECFSVHRVLVRVHYAFPYLCTARTQTYGLSATQRVDPLYPFGPGRLKRHRLFSARIIITVNCELTLQK